MTAPDVQGVPETATSPVLAGRLAMRIREATELQIPLEPPLRPPRRA